MLPIIADSALHRKAGWQVTDNEARAVLGTKPDALDDEILCRIAALHCGGKFSKEKAPMLRLLGKNH